MSEITHRAEERGKPGNATTYFVNGEALTTTEHKLTVRTVLESAGFTPAEDYRLTRDQGNHVYDDYDEDIPLRENERFTATYLGVTPTS